VPKLKDDFYKYLATIGITTKPLVTRVQFSYDLASTVCPEEIEGIFVCDVIDAEGNRKYTNLWFFSKGYCMESKNFMSEDNIDIMPSQNVVYCQITLRDYDLDRATQEARLTLELGFSHDLYANLQAAGENCQFLRDIALTYFKPRLVG